MLNQLMPLIGQFPLKLLFAPNYAGGLYQPLVAYQDVNGTVPAPAAGDTIAEIADQHTTVETFTTFYTSDFSAGVDSWTGTQGTAAGNIDSILGRNDCLRLTFGAAGGATYLERTLAFFGTTRNRTVISVYVPAAQTYVDGFRVYAGDNSTGTLIYDGANNGSTGAWVDIDVTKYVGSTTIRVYAYIGASATISALGVGSLMYVRGMQSSYTNLVNQYQPVLASRPYMGSYPNVPGGLGVRNRLSNNQMIGASAPSTFPTSWIVSPNATATVTFVASGTSSGRKYGDFRIVETVSGQTSIIFSGTTQMPALAGQTWTNTFDHAIAAGSLTNVALLENRIVFRTSGGAGVNSQNVAYVPTASMQTTTNTFLAVGATIAAATGQTAISFSGAGDLTLRIFEPQPEVAAAATARQKVSAIYDVSEAGYPSVLMPYGSGSKMLTTGVVGFGAATQGFFAEVGQNWTLQGVLIGFGTGVIAAQTEQAADANQMFNWRATATAMELVLRGTVNTYTATPTNGGALKYSIVCTNGVVTVNINGTGRQSATVGAAAAEAVYATFFARNNTTPAGFYTGFAQPVDFIDKSQSVVEESSFFTTGRRLFGGV